MDHPKYFCFYYGRRDRLNYKYSYEQIKEKYPFIQMHGIMPEALSGAMGNEFFIAKFEDFKDLENFKNMVEEKND